MIYTKYSLYDYILILSFLISISHTISQNITIGCYYGPNRFPHIYLYAVEECNLAKCIPGYNVSLKLIPRSTEQGPNILYAAKTYSNYVTYVGPHISQLASGIAALLGYVNRPMMGSTETSPILSDKVQYPTYLRVCPPDQLQGYSLAAFVKQFSFTHVNVIYTSDIYGEALSNIVSKTIQPVVISMSRSFSRDSTSDLLSLLLDEVIASGTKINIVAAALNETISNSLIKTITKKNAYDGYVWIFTDGLVSASTTEYGQSPKGIIGTLPGYNESRYNNWMDKYNNRDNSRRYPEFGPYLNSTGGWDPYIYDSMWAVLYGIKSTVLNGESVYDGKALLARTKKIKFEGLTGTVYFDEMGDRSGSLIQYLNYNGVSWVKKGYWIDTQGVVISDSIVWPGGRNNPPLARNIESNSSSKSTNSHLVLILAIIFSVVFVVTLVISIFLWRKKQWKMVKIAPTGKVCLVFTDIEDGDTLWEGFQDQMKEVVVLHEKMIRRIIEQYKGYEVKTIGESFMVSFNNCVNAIGFCNEVQMSALHINWPPSILENPSCAEQHDQENNLIYRGPRIRVGVHYGEMDAQINDRLGTIDYFGRHVNIAARVSGLAKGGQIIVTEDVKLELDKDISASYLVRRLGSCDLRGIGDYELYDVVHQGLQGRPFHSIETYRYNQQKDVNILEKIRKVKPGYSLCWGCSRLLKCSNCTDRDTEYDDTSSQHSRGSRESGNTKYLQHEKISVINSLDIQDRDA
eukprot:NODE_556_length_2599_cov_40.721325_g477_i0.p1 GENE.NODE_556_length_2599_cov_40.721325_g477_i0~~NODE_556_length_2599_cov_40.721325_g477_i0.p1  ORF type:complete len:743 (-),score=95.12 NODE_556_length_2599_cov_40.721325_g477_i0:305-2533(-)